MLESTDATVYRVEEWHARRIVMEATLDVLSDGQPHTSRDILNTLTSRGFTIPKRLVNSILFSEARRYVIYDRKSYTYRLRKIDIDEMDSAITDIGETNLDVAQYEKGEIKARYIGRNDEYVFMASNSTEPSFFRSLAKSRTIEIVLNREHPLYEDLNSLLRTAETLKDSCSDGMRQQLIRAQKVLKLMLASWAGYETSLPDGRRRVRAEESRIDWGRKARYLMQGEIEEE